MLVTRVPLLLTALLFAVSPCRAMSMWNFLVTDHVDSDTAGGRVRRDAIDNEIIVDDIDDIEEVVSSSRPVVYSLHVQSDIRFRFANTLVTSRLANRVNASREALFTMELPEAGFITNFTLHIDKRVILGEVKEKEEAKELYEAAVSQGQTAAHISAKPRETNRFTIAVNMAAFTKLSFELTYQEFLERKFSSYVHVINIKPGQVVRDMKVDVNIVENRRLTMVKVPPISQDIATKHFRANKIREEQEYVEVTYGEDGHSAFIEFHPDPDHQIAITSNATGTGSSVDGIQGQFAVYYDVERTADVGEVYMYNGYFVHFFAPTELEVVSKQVLFVLDVSGSMSGTKIAQLREAMITILDELKPGDYFNIITFSSGVTKWRERSLSVNGDTITEAKRFVQSLEADGGTNINQALLDGITFLSSEESALVNIIVFLTDGEATSGVTRTSTILDNIRRANSDNHFPIYSLAFGRGADYDFVQKMSLQHSAIARKIYEDSDAALQLKGFYDEISSPLLANVNVTYLNDTVQRETLVRNQKNKNYFDGCEIVICGQLVRPPYPLVGRPGLLRDEETGRGADKWVSADAQGAVDEREEEDDELDVEDDEFEDDSDESRDLQSERRGGSTGGGGGGLVIPYISASGADGSVIYTDVVVDEDSEQTAINLLALGIERMWAYLTIKDLLNKEIELDDPEEKAAVKEKALQLSLKYKFVTPLTSMVVTLPEENKPPVALDNDDSASEDESQGVTLLSGSPGIGGLNKGSYYGAPAQAAPRFGGGGGRSASRRHHAIGVPGPSGGLGNYQNFPSLIKYPMYNLQYAQPPPFPYPTAPRLLPHTTTTTTTSTTTPPPALTTCQTVNEAPNSRYRISYDSFADFEVSGTTSQADVHTGAVYVSAVTVASRSLSFRIRVSFPDINVNHTTDYLGWQPLTLAYHGVEVRVSEYEVVVSITDTLNRVSMVRVQRDEVRPGGEHCLSYTVSGP